MTVTLDGYATGVGQSRESPFGHVSPQRLHAWMFEYEEENRAEREAITKAGAYIMGRKMFSSDEGEWDLDWTGYWGDEPPYHAPTFILCHRPRPSIEKEGGTTFHFVTDGIEAAMEMAQEAAGEKDVSIAGGPSTLNQYLAAGMVDELRLHVSPIAIGGGERVFTDVGDLELTPISSRTTSHVTHVVYGRR
jgi:dihydrofolate reductase